MLPRADLLQGAEYRETLARVLDLGEQALKTWQVVWSDFLSPPEIAEVQARLCNLTELQVGAWGGYPQAERQRIALARSEVGLDVRDPKPDPEGIPLAAIQIQGNFLFDPATHRDFLGALLASGIAREKVGDILLLGDSGAQAIVVPEMVDYLTLNLTQVRTVPVKVSRILLSQLNIQPPPRQIHHQRGSLFAPGCGSLSWVWHLPQQNGGRNPTGGSAGQLEAHYPSQLHRWPSGLDCHSRSWSAAN